MEDNSRPMEQEPQEVAPQSVEGGIAEEGSVEMDNPFDRVGVSLEVGTHLFNALRIGPGDLMNPANVSKLEEIAEFLEGEKDPFFVINKVIRTNKNPGVQTWTITNVC